MASRRTIKDVLFSTRRRALAFAAAVSTVTGAIGGVYALLPRPSDTHEVTFGDVTSYSGVSLEEYDVRASHLGAVHTVASTGTSTGLVAYRLAADVSGSPRASSSPQSETPSSSSEPAGEPAGEPTTEPTTPGSATPPTSNSPENPPGEDQKVTKLGAIKGWETPASTDGTGTTEAPPSPTPPSSAFHKVGGVQVVEGTGASQDKVEQVLHTLAAEPGETEVVLPDTCSTSCGATQVLDKALTYDQDPVKAAQAVATAFKNSRARHVGDRIYPIGAMVSYTLKFDGLKGREVKVEWSLFSQGGHRTPPRPWWRNMVVAHYRPSAPHESTGGIFWIAVPQARSDYVVHVIVTDSKGVQYAATDAKPIFH